MLIGYARVSKRDNQDPALQIKALKQAGVKRIFTESASGGRWDRPELQKMLEQLRKGDVIVVWKMDRLSRSLQDLLNILEKIRQTGAGFKSITEPIDTTTAAGRAMAQMIGIFAEFERSIIKERTKAGLAAARDKGRIGGRRPKLTFDQRSAAIQMIKDGKTSAAAARIFGVHRSTIGRLMDKK